MIRFRILLPILMALALLYLTIRAGAAKHITRPSVSISPDGKVIIDMRGRSSRADVMKALLQLSLEPCRDTLTHEEVAECGAPRMLKILRNNPNLVKYLQQTP